MKNSNSKGFFASLFAPRKLPEEIRREKRINANQAFNRQERAFNRYSRDIETSIARFKLIAIEAHKKGQMNNALAASRFVARMENIREKISSVNLHFQMLRCLTNVSDVMVQFMDSCAEAGFDMNQTIDIDALTSGQYNMEAGLDKLQWITERVDEILGKLDDFAEPVQSADSVFTAEDQATLDRILGESSAVPAPAFTAPVPAAPAPVDPVPAPAPAATVPAVSAPPAIEPAAPDMNVIEMNRLDQRLSAS